MFTRCAFPDEQQQCPKSAASCWQDRITSDMQGRIGIITMKFRTKLIITFLTVILLPLLLSAIAFLAIGAVLIHNSDLSYGFETTDYSTMSDSLASFSDITDDIFVTLSSLRKRIRPGWRIKNILRQSMKMLSNVLPIY